MYDFLFSEVWHIDNRTIEPEDSGRCTGWLERNIERKERKDMLILGIAEVIAMLFCAGIMYCCILVGKHSDEEEKRLWEMKRSREQKVEEEGNWEEQE